MDEMLRILSSSDDDFGAGVKTRTILIARIVLGLLVSHFSGCSAAKRAWVASMLVGGPSMQDTRMRSARRTREALSNVEWTKKYFGSGYIDDSIRIIEIEW